MRIAVHLHLFYTEMTDVFLDKIRNLSGFKYDLFVTLIEENAEVIQRIKAFDSKTTIWIVPNKGYDVGPFIHFLNCIDLDQYGAIIKLHTKNQTWTNLTKINHTYVDNRAWLAFLLDALLKDGKTVKNNIKLLKADKSISMLGSSHCLTSEKSCYEYMLPQIKGVMGVVGCAPASDCSFIAGTMFMARSFLFKPIKEAYTIDDFDDTDGDVKDGTLAHVLERVFGIVASRNGFRIEGVGSVSMFKARCLLKYVFRFIYHEKNNREKHVIRILGIRVYQRFKYPVKSKLSPLF